MSRTKHITRNKNTTKTKNKTVILRKMDRTSKFSLMMELLAERSGSGFMIVDGYGNLSQYGIDPADHPPRIICHTYAGPALPGSAGTDIGEFVVEWYIPTDSTSIHAAGEFGYQSHSVLSSNFTMPERHAVNTVLARRVLKYLVARGQLFSRAFFITVGTFAVDTGNYYHGINEDSDNFHVSYQINENVYQVYIAPVDDSHVTAPWTSNTMMSFEYYQEGQWYFNYVPFDRLLFESIE